MSENVTTSEPTTGEIVRALLNRSVDKKSFYRRKIELIAADRLKTQERDIEWMSKKFDEVYKTWRESDSVFLEKIATLTARADQAEAAIDLTAIRIMRYIIENGVEIEEWNEPCVLCEHYNSNHGKCGSCYTTQEFELRHDLRGLPQDGEGKK